MHLLLFTPRMDPLAHIHMYFDNTAAQGWSNRGSFRTASAVVPILRELSLEPSRQHIHASVGSVPGEDNNMADAASRLTHLPDRQSIYHFRTLFPHSKPWRLIPLPSGCKKQLTSMLHNKQSPRGSWKPSSRKTPPPGANCGASAAGCKLPPTSKIFRTPFPSSKFSLGASVPFFCPCKVNPSRSDRSSNTSARSVKSSHLRGATTPNTTAWGRSTFGWDASWRLIRSSILLHQECGPSLLALSKPWTPPPRELPQEISQSEISPGWPSASSSGQANTARVVPTPPSTPSCSRRSNFSL